MAAASKAPRARVKRCRVTERRLVLVRVVVDTAARTTTLYVAVRRSELGRVQQCRERRRRDVRRAVARWPFYVATFACTTRAFVGKLPHRYSIAKPGCQGDGTTKIRWLCKWSSTRYRLRGRFYCTTAPYHRNPSHESNLTSSSIQRPRSAIPRADFGAAPRPETQLIECRRALLYPKAHQRDDRRRRPIDGNGACSICVTPTAPK